MTGTPIAAYTNPDGEPRLLVVVLLDDPAGPSGRLPVALLAARLQRCACLLLDLSRDGGDARVVGEHAAGEGLHAVRALADDYRPRAERARRPIARPLSPDDVLAAGEPLAA